MNANNNPTPVANTISLTSASNFLLYFFVLHQKFSKVMRYDDSYYNGDVLRPDEVLTYEGFKKVEVHVGWQPTCFFNTCLVYGNAEDLTVYMTGHELNV